MRYISPEPIAVLLAVYNGEKYLREQIDSILAQTNHDWVLYIRDDASTDSTPEIIADYCQKYDNIVKIGDDRGNLGCYENFRELLRSVEADYYMFSDADDVWLPEKIQASFDFLHKQEGAYPHTPLLVHCDKSHADAELNIIHKSVWSDSAMDPDSWTKFELLPMHIVGGACSIFNRRVRDLSLESPPPNIMPVSHDGWAALIAAKFGKIFALRDPLLIYRYHGSNTTVRINQAKRSVSYRLAHLCGTLGEHYKKYKMVNSVLGYGSFGKYVYYRIVAYRKSKRIR